MMRVFFSTAAMTATLVQAQPAADKITKLPGIDKLPSDHYSGYLTGNNNAQLHYYVAYAEDVDPSTAPVILWTNGGPGCSAFEGWGYELGPFRFRSMGQKKSDFPMADGEIQLNPFSWNKKANVLFLEQPAGVGFSYMPDLGSYSTGDVQNAKDNYAALQAFYKKFPNFKSNPLYLSGESYAGIYIPTLAHEILSGADTAMRTALAGMMVGNGVTTPLKYDNIQFYYQGLASFNERYTGKGYNNLLNPYGLQRSCYNPNDRADLMKQAVEDAKVDGIPWYHRRGADAAARAKTGKPTLATQRRQAPALKSEGPEDHPPETSNVLCADAVTLTTYLNRQDVQEALHVKSPGGNGWGLCSDLSYASNWPTNMIPIYNAMMKANKKVLMYVGASDAVCPWTDQAEFIPEYTDWEVTRPMMMWAFDDPTYPYGEQVGGSVTQFNGTKDNTTSGIWLTTMRGCGHMVPQDCPAAAAYMVEQVVSGTFWNQNDFLEQSFKLGNGPACGAKDEL